ncbi:MAG: DMT family transporter [Planctomycetota bacterium]
MRRQLAKLTGLRAMVASALLFSVMAALIKAAARTIPSVEVVVIRNLVHAAIFVPLWWATTDRSLGNKKLLVARGVLGLCALEAYAWTLGAMPLADAWILQAMNPVFVALLAPLILKERSAGHIWLALVLGLGGAALIVRPGFHVAWWPGLVGVAGGLASGLAYMTVRMLGRSEHPLTVVMAFPVVAGPLALPFALPVWVWPDLVETAAMVGAAVAAAGGQYLLTVGLKSSHAAPATTSTYVGFVFATALGLVFFDEPLVWTTVVGSVSIFAGVALLGRRAVTVRPTAARGVAPTVTTET